MEANQSTALVAVWGGSLGWQQRDRQNFSGDSYSFLTLQVNGDNLLDTDRGGLY